MPRQRPPVRSVRPGPSLPTMLRRGALRHCPWCGDRRAYFTGWFAKQDACRRCEMPWRRSDVGFELGAMTVNTILTFGLIVVGVTAGMIATAPDFAVREIVVGLVVGAAVVPVVLYPVSYTLWQAIDLAMRPPRPEDHRKDHLEGRREGHRENRLAGPPEKP